LRDEVSGLELAARYLNENADAVKIELSKEDDEKIRKTIESVGGCSGARFPRLLCLRVSQRAQNLGLIEDNLVGLLHCRRVGWEISCMTLVTGQVVL